MADIGHYVSKTKEKEKRRKRQAFLSAAFALVFLFLLAIAWVLFRAPLFKYKEFEVTGNISVPSSDIRDIFFASYRNQSFLRRALGARNMLAWPKELGEKELALLPLLRSVKVEKNYWNRKIVLHAEERSPYGMWCNTNENEETNTSCWWFDEAGIMFERSLFSGEGSLIKVAHDYSGRNLGLGAQVLPADEIPHLLSIFSTLREVGISPKEVAIKNLSRSEVEVETHSGPIIYFSLRFGAQNAASVLRSLKEKGEFENLGYIDFRVEHRAYYK